jgi:hypothetical protein
VPVATSVSNPYFQQGAQEFDYIKAYLFIHKTQCQDTAVLPSQIMARLVPNKILAPLWSATQFSTILVLAFRDMTITP